MALGLFPRILTPANRRKVGGRRDSSLPVAVATSRNLKPVWLSAGTALSRPGGTLERFHPTPYVECEIFHSNGVADRPLRKLLLPLELDANISFGKSYERFRAALRDACPVRGPVPWALPWPFLDSSSG